LKRDFKGQSEAMKQRLVLLQASEDSKSTQLNQLTSDFRSMRIENQQQALLIAQLQESLHIRETELGLLKHQLSDMLTL
jgi:hypothetical protein